MAKRAAYSDGPVDEAALAAFAEELRAKLGDRIWRVCNLYSVENKEGEVGKFTPNWAQMELLASMHNRELVLKARQIGFTTFFQILMLDACLFNSNTHCATVTLALPAGRKVMRDKVLKVYQRLLKDERIPLEVRLALPQLTTENTDELGWSNGSTIYVAVTPRGGTLHWLHVSEFGKIAARSREKAREVRTGGIPTLGENGVCFIESTAEGEDGDFFEMSETARLLHESGKDITRKDFTFRFYPWWREPLYRLSDEDTALVVIPDKWERYFDELEKLCQEEYPGMRLDANQRAWYVKTEETQKGDMKREYPSTPKEPFEAAIEGAFYSDELETCIKAQRIRSAPWNPKYKVHVALDLGMRDRTAAWFFQLIGNDVVLIDYEEYASDSLITVGKAISAKPYIIGALVCPHDIRVRDYTIGEKRLNTLETMGFEVIVAPSLTIRDGINAVRVIFPRFIFDEANTSLGVKRVKNYKREWDTVRGVWKPEPRHDENSHGADGLRMLAVAIDLIPRDPIGAAADAVDNFVPRRRVA